jgi:hypothetical protein
MNPMTIKEGFPVESAYHGSILGIPGFTTGNEVLDIVADVGIPVAVVALVAFLIFRRREKKPHVPYLGGGLVGGWL